MCRNDGIGRWLRGDGREDPSWKLLPVSSSRIQCFSQSIPLPSSSSSSHWSWEVVLPLFLSSYKVWGFTWINLDLTVVDWFQCEPLNSLYTLLQASIGTWILISLNLTQVLGWIVAREAKVGSFLTTYATLLHTSKSRCALFSLQDLKCWTFSFLTFAYIVRVCSEIRKISSLSEFDRYEHGSPFRSPCLPPTSGKLDFDGWSMMQAEVISDSWRYC